MAALTSGEHDFQDLGAGFYSSQSVQRVKRARLVLLDFEAAEAFGLGTDDVARLEKALTDAFAFQTTTSILASKARGFLERLGVNTSSDAYVKVENSVVNRLSFFRFLTLPMRRYMATRYSHSDDRGNSGDGRVVWTGQIEVRLKDGRRIVLDVTAKGIGRTDLVSQHSVGSDGLLTLKEAVKSFVTSKRNRTQNLDATIDLAVIRLPINKRLQNGQMVPAAVSVRIGNQFRPAHLGYHLDDSKRMRKIREFVVRRSLGKQADSPVTPKDVETYVWNFVRNLGEQRARMDDLNVYHTVPHHSNATAEGGLIDQGSVEQTRGGYKYRTNDMQSDYIDFLLTYLGLHEDLTNTAEIQSTEETRAAVQKELGLNISIDALNKEYENIRQSLVVELRLSRLGLTPRQIETVPQKLKDLFAASTEMLSFRAPGTAPVYDVQDLLARAFEGDTTNEAGFSDLVEKIARSLGSDFDRKTAIERARAILPSNRNQVELGEPVKTGEESRLLKQAEDPSFGLKENSELADKIVRETSHHIPIPRRFTSLSHVGAVIEWLKTGEAKRAEKPAGIFRQLFCRRSHLR